MSKVSDWFKSLGRSINEATNLHLGESWNDYSSRVKNAWSDNNYIDSSIKEVQERPGINLKDVYKGAQSAVEDFTGVSAQKEIQDSINKTNLEMTNATNEMNYLMNQESNDINREINENTNIVNHEIADQTNQMNFNINQENLAYQRELQEYQKALQEKIFEREDTAYQRTAQDMIDAGLNPLSMQGTNGAGEVISMSPLQNSFQAQIGNAMQSYENKSTRFDSPYFQNQIQMKSIADFLASTTGLIQGIQQLKTGSLQRDGIALENDKKRIDNFLEMAKNGIQRRDDLPEGFGSSWYIYNDMENEHTKSLDQFQIKQMKDRYEALNSMREYEHLVKNNMYSTDNKYEQMLTAFEDWIINGRGEQAFEKLIEKYPILGTFYNKNKKEAQ